MGKLSVAVVGMCAALVASAQEGPADFTHRVPLSVSGNGPWYRLELPLAVQLNARQADLSDVRVFNAAGEPQAYALSRQSSQRTESRNVADVKWFPLYAADTQETLPGVVMKTTSEGTLVEIKPSSAAKPGKQVLRGWVLDASAIKAPLQQLSLDWSREQEGFQRFSIEASDDLQRWEPWGEGQVARLSFADERVEQHDVSLPGRPARYLRLVWKGQAAPLLTSAKLVSATRSSLPMPLVWSQPVAGTRLKAGEYSWQLPTGLSVERLRIELKQPNTLAPVTLSGRSDAKQTWQPLSNGLLYRLTQNGQDVVQDELQLPGQVVTELKLQVDERGGGLGVDAPALRFAVRATQLVFLARGEPPFSLALGNASVKSANLPLSTLIPDYSAERLDTLGQAKVAGEMTVASPAVVAAVDDGPNWKKLGLWAVLLLGVAALGGMAYSLLRKPPAAR
ncbi:DUF3999 domain-containing protein [Pseudomonas fluorescens]|uniref:DUF3999 family protein n=1 Tax=Pseudomonas fluorescens TaxID=294 RepID=UPI00177B1B34|nr:DUF3999 domain-containing protein [Pseudomonas fluorescens]MBD8226394.1 DUF3999 domain-containing protein [Pseudomonas fluorescens]MBD8784107.1 DUF3999 domain-containing protein [Pseudomonas fluorescens]MBD8816787.1 DUF3999 domain-containing protein [Pseudomonas fluorescens]